MIEFLMVASMPVARKPMRVASIPGTTWTAHDLSAARRPSRAPS